MKHIIIILLLTLSVTLVHAQIVTPGLGQTYTFQDFATAYPTSVTTPSSGHYTLLQDITISAGDTLLLDANTQEILCYNPITLTIHGTVASAPRTDTLLFTCNTSNCNGDYYEILLDDAESSRFANILFEYGNHIQVMQSEVSFEQCVFRYFQESCIKYSNANPVIENCTFYENRKAAISSAANVTGAPVIRYNTFYHNVLNNINQPQINLGPGNAGDTVVIEGNHIEGCVAMSGGIAIANLLGVGHTNAIIRNNTVVNNRYGYTQQGPGIEALIEDNTFKDNNLETNPMNGGSGISIYGSDTTCRAKLRRNLITGNLWGITAINKHRIDMGTVNDPGNNCLFNNSNGGVEYNLYNNATCDIEAVGNFWGDNDSTYAESVITHYADNSQYGLVNYLPVLQIEPDILSFSLWDGQMDLEFYPMGGDTLFYGVGCVVPDWYDIAPTMVLPMWVTCSPDPSLPQNFLTETPVIYTLTTVDGRSKEWVIYVTFGPGVVEYGDLPVTVTPNPATSGRLVLHNDSEEAVQVEVYALTGQKVYAAECHGTQMVMNTSTWNSGVYLLKATQNGRSRTFKVVVNH